MRAISLVSVLLLAGCGSVDDGTSSVCDLAAEHLASCNGQPASAAPGTCDAAAAAEANTILGHDCSSLKSFGVESGRQPSWWWSGSACSDPEEQLCDSYCEKLFDDSNLRLVWTTCRVLDEGSQLPDGRVTRSNQVHCQCKGYRVSNEIDVRIPDPSTIPASNPIPESDPEADSSDPEQQAP